MIFFHQRRYDKFLIWKELLFFCVFVFFYGLFENLKYLDITFSVFKTFFLKLFCMLLTPRSQTTAFHLPRRPLFFIVVACVDNLDDRSCQKLSILIIALKDSSFVFIIAQSLNTTAVCRMSLCKNRFGFWSLIENLLNPKRRISEIGISCYIFQNLVLAENADFSSQIFFLW